MPKYVAITRPYEETFVEVMKLLSKEKEEDVLAIGTIVLTNDGYYVYYGNASLMDKHTMASVIQCDVMHEEQNEDIAEAVADVMTNQASGAILSGIKAVLDVMGLDYDEEDLAEAGRRLKGVLEGGEDEEDGYPVSEP